MGRFVQMKSVSVLNLPFSLKLSSLLLAKLALKFCLLFLQDVCDSPVLENLVVIVVKHC